MARFYGSIYGSGKTIAQKAGSKDSGINAHIRGWNIGVNVNLLVDKDVKLAQEERKAQAELERRRFKIHRIDYVIYRDYII